MPMTYSVSLPDRTVRIRGTGAVSAEELQEYFRKSRSDPAVTPDMCRWVDFRGVTSFPSTEDIRSSARTLQVSGSVPTGKTAFIVDSDLAAGVAMMFAGMTGMTERTQTFTDEAAAEAWLSS